MKSIKYILAIVFVLVGLVGLKAFANTLVVATNFTTNEKAPVDDSIVSTEPVLIGIEITNPATKLSYTVGDTLDLTGLVVTGTYNDDTTKIEDITLANITGFKMFAIGHQVLTITVGGKTATFGIDVTSVSVAPVLVGIQITNPATKLSYTVGDTLDLTGLVVTGTYNDDTTKVEHINLSNVTGFDKTVAGSQVLTITVGDQTANFTVNVADVQVVVPPSSGGNGGGGNGGGGFLFRPVVVTPLVGKVLGAEKFIFTRLLKKGSKGNEVTELQKFLNAAGYDCGTADGKFGSKTKAAVMKFQTAKTLKSDGIAGKDTRTELNK